MKALKSILAILLVSKFSPALAQGNQLRFDSVPSESLSIGVNSASSKAPEGGLIEQNGVYVNVVDGNVQSMSTCNSYIDSGLGHGLDGLYKLNEKVEQAYCDMSSADGGWMLVGLRSGQTIDFTPVDSVTSPSQYDTYLSEEKWHKLRPSVSEMRVVLSDGAEMRFDIDRIESANCVPFEGNLGSVILFSHENSGCSRKGSDYSQYHSLNNGRQTFHGYGSFHFNYIEGWSRSTHHIADKARIWVR